MTGVKAYIALGSNLGDRAAHIERALDALERHDDVTITARSTVIETPALTLPGSPPQPPYLNAAVEVSTTLPPRGLLAALLSIERSLGRDRAAGERWAARTIDLDLLLYADAVIDEPECAIPHPRLHERDFVLQPLAEIAPNALHPVLHKTVTQLLEAFDEADKPRRPGGGGANPPARRAAPLLIALTTCLAPVCPLLAQDETPAAPLEATDLDAALDLVRTAYRSAPTAESLMITASADDVSSTREVSISIDPRVPSAALTLGPLHVFALPGEVLAAHDDTPTRYARIRSAAPTPAAALDAAVPPLPMPELAAAFSTDPRLADLFPFAGPLIFTSAVEGQGEITLSARSAEAEARFVVDAETGRFLQIYAFILDSSLSLNITVTPIEDAPPAALDLARTFADRRAVPSIDLLDPSIEDVAPGSPTPRMPLFDLECSPWRPDLEDGPLAIVFYRGIIPQARVARAVVARRVPLHAVVVLEGLEGVALFERIGQTVQHWGEPVNWTLSPKATLNRFTASAPAVFVLIDDKRTIRAIVPLDESMSEREVATAIRNALDALEPSSP